MIPRPGRAKRALAALAALAAVLAAAGCGGGGRWAAAGVQHVAGPGYRFAAPSGWRVTRSRLTVGAAHRSDVVEVSTFPLLKPYRPALFAAVEPELRTRLRQLVAKTGGSVGAAGSVVAGGVRAHVYHVRGADYVDEYTFVLVGRREYQLLCRHSGAGAAPCRQLQTSFRLT